MVILVNEKTWTQTSKHGDKKETTIAWACRYLTGTWMYLHPTRTVIDSQDHNLREYSIPNGFGEGGPITRFIERDRHKAL